MYFNQGWQKPGLYRKNPTRLGLFGWVNPVGFIRKVIIGTTYYTAGIDYIYRSDNKT